jgi:serine/threonine-protein kinase HipA
MPAASSTVMHFGDEVAFVVERYDRRIIDRRIVRIHQEDMCQAFGVPPTKKYENEGGPSISRIVDFLRENSGSSSEDVQTFIDAVAYNWLIGGTDAHAKNYSILIGAGGRVRLAPLYDLASVLPYDEFDPLKLKLAMKLGGKYRLRDISARSWEKLSEELRMDKKEITGRVCEMARKVPVEARAIRKRLEESGIKHPVLDRLTERLTAHAEKCERLFSL